VETTVELDKEKKYICPNCGAEMKKSIESSDPIYICEECGCTIEGEEQNFDTMGCCPNCNQSLDGNECPYCGYDLGSDFA
jgi:DNA-directed RNA polymerase subunit RPC12/RpoP